MSWQLLVPIVEKLIDAGVEYYKSDVQTQGTVAATEVAAPAKAGATILLAVEYTTNVSEDALRAMLDEMAKRNDIRVTHVDINIDEVAKDGT